jgi:hypothetical protein
MEKIGAGGDRKLQKFIHQFVSAVTGRPAVKEEISPQLADSEEVAAVKTEGDANLTTGMGSREQEVESHGVGDSDDEPGFTLVAVSGPTDGGETLEEWMKILQGQVVDVAANGNCGWIAFFAALYNEEEGLVRPTTGVVTQANELKRRVINEMLANLADEARLHPDDLRAEAVALGCVDEHLMSTMERLGVVGNHLAEQRAKSVKANVPMHHWVRPMHLKAMATYARETIYVLGVTEDNRARIQAYAYHDVQDGKGELVETGTVCPIPTLHAKVMLWGQEYGRS